MKRQWQFMTDETFYGEIWDRTDPDAAPVIAVMPELDDRPEELTLMAAAPDLLAALEAYQDANELRCYAEFELYQLAAQALAKARAVPEVL